MFSQISNFVSNQPLLMVFAFSLMKYKTLLFSIHKTFPKSKFKIGDWVWLSVTVDDPTDPEDGKTYFSSGYVTGIVYHHPELNVRDVYFDYGYYVQFVYEDGLKVSSREAELCLEYELHLLG